MCGIAGLIDTGAGFGPERIAKIALAMRDTMVYRGPDDAGIWVNKSATVALAHRRLSIIDLTAGAKQPMPDATGTAHTTFNGEIYNYKELRKELVSKGVRFTTNTDTEVIPNLYRQHGEQFVQRLDGMYSLGIWDEQKHQLTLARDPFGKKPLYYGSGPGWFAFASEQHALFQIPGYSHAIDQEAIALYLMLQYIPAPKTIHKNVYKLQPGSVLTLDLSKSDPKPQVNQWWKFDAKEGGEAAKLSRADRLDRLDELIQAAVSKRLVSDVPLGAFLSAGVDSSLIVAVMAKKMGADVRTFSVGFSGDSDSEHFGARKTAEYLGTVHNDQVIQADGLLMMQSIAEELDEPNGDPSCLPTLLLSKHTRQFVTVALSGDGGDELFGGYGRYRDTMNESADWKTRFGKLVRDRKWWTPATGYLSPRWLMFQPEYVQTLMGGLPDGVDGMIDGWRDLLTDRSRSVMARMRTLDAGLYLPGAVLAKVDRMSMRASLEVRCPLLDRDLAEFAMGLPQSDCWQAPDGTKRILKDLAARYLPEEWVNRPKRGFGPPASLWPADSMMEMARDTLGSNSGELKSFLDPEIIDQLIEHQSQPNMFSIYQMWPLMILELWLRARRSGTPIAQGLGSGVIAAN